MSLDKLIAAMAEPGFYPQQPAQVEYRQTHISCVFLAGDFVYKIKKPVHFEFLDYSTLERRYHFCQEEVRLNRRLAPRVYLGVFAIVRDGERFAIGTKPAERFDPNAAEYAVKMCRLPDECCLDRLVQSGRVDAATMRRVGALLARFHDRAARARSMEYGCADAISQSIGINLEECRPFVGDTIGEREFHSVSRFNQRFIETHRELLERRARNGMVREGHGDLRSEHICIRDDVEVIDCVEFSDRLRYADIASDLAFLLMDLDRLQAPALGHHLLRAYLDEIGDAELCRLLNFYKCYRATVRGKVSSLKAREREIPDAQQQRARESARNFFSAAYRYAKAGSPALIVICGLPGTGKSTIAAALAERSGLAVFNSDLIRKRIAGIAPTERAGAGWRQGIYSEDFTAATYDALAEEATKALRAGNGVIADATYRDNAQRMRLRNLACLAGVPIVFAECALSDGQARQRLAARAQRPDTVSDATWETYLQHKVAFAPFGPEFADCHLRVDGSADPTDSACEIERFIAAHC
jgi:uncharacterized protein